MLSADEDVRLPEKACMHQDPASEQRSATKSHSAKRAAAMMPAGNAEVLEEAIILSNRRMQLPSISNL